MELVHKLLPSYEKSELEEIEVYKLGEIVEILDSKRKPITKKNRIQGEYPYYGANGIVDYVNNYIFDGKFLLVGEDGSVITKEGTPVIHRVEGKIWVNNHAHVLASSENKDYNLDYIFYYLSIVNVEKIVKGTPPKINLASLKDILIPIPNLIIQEKIVKILDSFTKYQEELKTNLAIEIDLRQKQYEYYREKLLDFRK